MYNKFRNLVSAKVTAYLLVHFTFLFSFFHFVFFLVNVHYIFSIARLDYPNYLREEDVET